MDAISWIEQNGKYTRAITAGVLRRACGRGKGECTWCGVPVPKPRRTWCSDECLKKFSLRCDPSAIRRAVRDRDQLVCQICGLDLGWLSRLIERIRRANADPVCTRFHRKINRRGKKNLRRNRRYIEINRYDYSAAYSVVLGWLYRRGFDGRRGGDLYEIDHIVPVVEGGGLCELSNYRLLCLPCHKEESRKLKARRSKRKDSHEQGQRKQAGVTGVPGGQDEPGWRRKGYLHRPGESGCVAVAT